MLFHLLGFQLLIFCWITPVHCFQIPKLSSSGRSSSYSQLSSTRNDENEAGLDSIRRRRLILSSLIASTGATAAAALFRPTPAALAADTETTVTTPLFKALTTSDFILPPLDDRQYLYKVLDENLLQVILVSDPDSKEVACCMNVHVGACSDGAIQGLAHFQEHMLFLGTAEYPQEDSFERFLSLNGGSSNAYTASEDTVYYFTMESPSKLQEGLQRFGSFFINPLFTESATGRELNAINSEHAKNVQSDSFRIYQLNKGRANNNHPFHHFFTGNYETLRDSVSTQNLRQALIQFNQDHYSSNQMSLAVVGPQSVKELEKMTQKVFSKVPNRQSMKPELDWKGIKIYSDDAPSLLPSFGSIVEMIPVQPLRQLTLSFPIQIESEEQRQELLYNKQDYYISHLLGHEGPNSLLSFLKYEKDWAESLATAADNELSDLSTLDVTIELTKEGLNHVNEIIEYVFGTFQLYASRPIPDYVLQECVQLLDLEWRFATKGSPTNYVQSLATNLNTYGAQRPELIVAAPRRLALSDPTMTSAPRTNGQLSGDVLQQTQSLIQNVLHRYLTVDNALITIMSQDLKGGGFQKEKWYGTEYRVKSIPSSVLQKWKNAPVPPTVQYPKPNVFLPTEQGLQVKIVPNKKITAKQMPSPPSIIRQDERWTVHYKADDRYGQPKAFCVIELYNTGAFYASARDVALGMLYVTSVLDRLEESVYDARLVGLTCDLQLLPKGLRVSFGGYNELLPQYVTQVLSQFQSGQLLPQTPKELDRYQDSLRRGLEAFDTKQPYAHASYYAYLTLQPPQFQFSNDNIRQAAATLTLKDLQNFKVWDRTDYIHGEALIQGNWNEKEALQLMSNVETTLVSSGNLRFESSGKIPKFQTLPLPSSNKLTQLVVMEPNPSNDNAAIHVLLQTIDRSRRSQVMMEILSNILSEPFYNQLRTQQQLGYIVSSGIRALEETRTLGFVVQSNTASVERITQSIVEYLDGVTQYLETQVTKLEFGNTIQALRDVKLEPDKTLVTETTRHWNEIAMATTSDSHVPQFDRALQEVEAASSLKLNDLIEFWKESLYAPSSKRMLITQVIPQQLMAKQPQKVADDVVVLTTKDISSFRQRQESNN